MATSLTVKEINEIVENEDFVAFDLLCAKAECRKHKAMQFRSLNHLKLAYIQALEDVAAVYAAFQRSEQPALDQWVSSGATCNMEAVLVNSFRCVDTMKSYDIRNGILRHLK